MSEHLWLVVSALLVFTMQAGFLCLESGRTRSKNSINVAAKNIADFILSAAIFWSVGFAFMFGSSYSGLIGTDGFFFGEHSNAYQTCFFLFQLMFCGTAATLTSGAAVERMTFSGYLFVTAILSIFIYPIVGHWVWTSLLDDRNVGWLESLGFIDFAGATVVHSVGGWIALAAIIVIGPRIGRFDSKRKLPSGSNLPMATMGTLLIWFGWFGFNGGSVLQLNSQVPGILLNTCLAAVWGGIAATMLHYLFKRYMDVSYLQNGIIAGLVGITASCHLVNPGSAALIGFIAGAILYFGEGLMSRLKIDDAIGVIPAHLFAGIWGTLAVAIFGQTDLINNGLSRLDQFLVQAFGIIVIGLYSFGLSYLLLRIIDLFHPLRVSPSDEIQGLNITEHRATTELIDLLGDMEKQQSQGNFTSPVVEEPFTEVGQIARKYNQVINRINQEIVQRDEALGEFQKSERRKSAILDSSMDCIISINSQGHIIEFNPAAERTLGCVKHQVKGKNFIDLFIVEDEQDRLLHSLKHYFSAATGLVLNRRNTVTMQGSSGNQFPAEITITSTRIGERHRLEFTLHIRDVTRDQKMQSKLKFLAYKDPLTNLSNRTDLMKRLRDAIAVSKGLQRDTVAVLFMDLDQFKKINDTLGHQAGDELLCEVARRLKQVCRSEDIIARWGGDEFIVAMQGDISRQIIASKAQEILDIMRCPVSINGKEFSIPTSIGIALSEHGEVSADQLIQSADIAMYTAKMNGRDNYQHFEPSMAEAATRSVMMEGLIKEGLESKEFSLFYQPKVHSQGDKVIALEALIRWFHPEKGMISPAEFIPIAENSNLIIDLDEYVLRTAVDQLSQWREQGINTPVSVNISGKSLISQQLVPYVERLLKEYQIPGQLLEIEITEGVLIQDIECCIEVLQQLKALNISVSIDDFGTGYSSLNYLKRLPLDILKIDQSFVDECSNKEEDRQICATIINLARSLNLKVVAEGVENQDQLSTLKKLGCEIFQGYYFYKPLPKDQVVKLLIDGVEKSGEEGAGLPV